jgi:phage gpG-like protein
MTDFQQKIAQVTRELPEIVKKLPAIGKVEGLQFIGDNFEKQGFETKKGTYKPWQKKRKGEKPTLIGEKRGGSLRRSWDSDTKTTATTIEFTSNLPYAGVHNEGLKAGRPPGFTMPERRMIGDSDALNDRIMDKVTREVSKVLNK